MKGMSEGGETKWERDRGRKFDLRGRRGGVETGSRDCALISRDTDRLQLPFRPPPRRAFVLPSSATFSWGWIDKWRGGCSRLIRSAAIKLEPREILLAVYSLDSLLLVESDYKPCRVPCFWINVKGLENLELRTEWMASFSEINEEI